MTTHAPGPTRSRGPAYPAPPAQGRGGVSGVEAQNPWGSGVPASPPSVPVRRTSQRGLLLSVLVVLVGGLLAFAGARQLTHHTLVLAVAADVPAGATVTAADLTTASISSDPALTPIPAGQRDQVVGQVAQVGLVKGELLTRPQIGPGTAFTPGQVLVALPLKEGQFPGQGLTAGQQVLIVATPGAGAVASASGNAPAGGGAGEPVHAVVASTTAADPATGVTVVDVRVPAAAGADLARLASTGNLALVLVPQGD